MFALNYFAALFIIGSFFITGIENNCGVYYTRNRGKREANENTRDFSRLDNQTGAPTNYIIGGRFVNPGEFPWQVFLKIYYNRNSYSYTTCGGVIWNSNFILTASHCLLQWFVNCDMMHVLIHSPDSANGYYRKPYRVVACVGEYNLQRRDGERCFNAWRWWTHKGFNPCNNKFKNDIAIIKLRDALQLPSFTNNGYGSLNSACHPLMEMNPKETTLSGWGRYNNWAHMNANVLKMVNLPIWSLQACRRIWDVSESQVCAGGVANENSCMGDSGGPLVTYYDNIAYVIGLSSYGPNPCAQRGVPNVFTKVAYFTDWINETINSN